MASVAGCDRGEQLANRDGQRTSKTDEYVCTGIRLRQLDTPDVFVIQPCQLREALLRELSLEAQPTQLVAQRAQNGRPRAKLLDRCFST